MLFGDWNVRAKFISTRPYHPRLCHLKCSGPFLPNQNPVTQETYLSTQGCKFPPLEEGSVWTLNSNFRHSFIVAWHYSWTGTVIGHLNWLRVITQSCRSSLFSSSPSFWSIQKHSSSVAVWLSFVVFERIFKWLRANLQQTPTPPLHSPRLSVPRPVPGYGNFGIVLPMLFWKDWTGLQSLHFRNCHYNIISCPSAKVLFCPDHDPVYEIKYSVART